MKEMYYKKHICGEKVMPLTRIIILSFLALLVNVSPAMAASEDLSHDGDTVYLDNAVVTKGTTSKVQLVLCNNSIADVQSVNAYFALPYGVKITGASLEPRANPAVLKPGAEPNVIMTNMKGGDAYMAILGCSGEVFAGTDGAIVTLDVAADSSAGEGDWGVSGVVQVCTSDNKLCSFYFQNPMTILPIADVLGDVNGDGVVSVADLSMMASYILGVHPDGFNAKSADANGDGDVSVADLSMVASMILGM